MAKLYFRYAAMNAGKSTQLLQIHHNYASQGMDVLMLTAQVDDRFGEGMITSRLGVRQPAETFAAGSDLYSRIDAFRRSAVGPVGAVLIDEAQFLSAEQVKQIHKAVHTLQVPVLCFGLRSDFMGRPFEGATMLLTLAEDIEELKNVCACGAKATMNIRVDKQGDRLQDGPQVLIGDATYRAVCGRCFYE